MNKSNSIRGKWVVHPHSYKESPEISIVRTSNEHGLRSFGWFDENKILISHDTMYGSLLPEVKEILIKYAIELAERMNKEEGND